MRFLVGFPDVASMECVYTSGFIVGGPFLAAVLAVAANYGSKQQNEAGDAVRAVGKTGIEILNFWTNINAKYDVTGELTLVCFRKKYEGVVFPDILS